MSEPKVYTPPEVPIPSLFVRMFDALARLEAGMGQVLTRLEALEQHVGMGKDRARE